MDVLPVFALEQPRKHKEERKKQQYVYADLLAVLLTGITHVGQEVDQVIDHPSYSFGDNDPEPSAGTSGS